MRKLHVQIFLTLFLVVILFGLLVSIAWWVRDDDERERRAFAAVQALIEEALPPQSTSNSQLQETLGRLGKRAGAYITVRNDQGKLLAAHGPPLQRLSDIDNEQGWTFSREGAAGLVLSDGRQVIAKQAEGDHDDHMHGFGFISVIVSFVIALGLGAYPMARRLTRRLQRLQMRVDELGAGELTARVDVEGRDEVAALATSFNRAADRIQHLVEAQKQTLAAASHELRSPLARIRMAFELLEQSDTPAEKRQDLRRRVERDINDLDDLIEELLLVSRLDTVSGTPANEPIDLLGLAAEEASRVDASAAGSPCEINGDKRLLRRLIRNLLENANKHGGGKAIEISVEPTPNGARLRVRDHGPGVPKDERERIFDPFFRSETRAEDNGGVGLGLYLVRQIARRHGGDVVCLESDTGAHFEVTLSTVESRSRSRQS